MASGHVETFAPAVAAGAARVLVAPASTIEMMRVSAQRVWSCSWGRPGEDARRSVAPAVHCGEVVLASSILARRAPSCALGGLPGRIQGVLRLPSRSRTPRGHGACRYCLIVEDGSRVIGELEHWVADEYVLKLPATAVNTVAVGRRLGDWLRASHVPVSTRAHVVLAVYEACANCVEHAYHDTVRGPMRVHAVPTATGLTVPVSDHGTWHCAATSARRGRGVPLMRALSHTLAMTRGATGTTVTLHFRWAGAPRQASGAGADGYAVTTAQTARADTRR